MTSVASTLRIPSSSQKPASSRLTPALSTSLSSVRLPIPIMISACGNNFRASTYLPSDWAKPKPIGSSTGSIRKLTRRDSRNSTVGRRVSRLRMSSGMTTSSRPRSAAHSRLLPLQLNSSSAPFSTAAVASWRSNVSMETRKPRFRKRLVTSPARCQLSPGMQPRSMMSAPLARNSSAF